MGAWTALGLSSVGQEECDPEDDVWLLKQNRQRGQAQPPRLETRKYHWLPPLQSKCLICRFKFCYLPTAGPSFSFGHDRSWPSGSTASNLAASHPFITLVPEYYFQVTK